MKGTQWTPSPWAHTCAQSFPTVTPSLATWSDLANALPAGACRTLCASSMQLCLTWVLVSAATQNSNVGNLWGLFCFTVCWRTQCVVSLICDGFWPRFYWFLFLFALSPAFCLLWIYFAVFLISWGRNLNDGCAFSMSGVSICCYTFPAQCCISSTSLLYFFIFIHFYVSSLPLWDLVLDL